MQIIELATCQFVEPHLVIAIAYRAIQNGFTARFVTAAVLIESLSVASRHGRLQ